MPTQRRALPAFALSLALMALSWLALGSGLQLGFLGMSLLWVLTMLPVGWLYRSVTVATESSLVWFVAWMLLGAADDWLLALLLLAPMLAWTAHPLRSGWAWLASVLALVAWVLGSPWEDLTIWHWLVWGATGLAWVLLLVAAQDTPRCALGKVDLVLSSYSANTAHLGEHFAAGLRRGGAQVTLHRFHHVDNFHPQLSGDALVLAFPVFGWKPPWVMADWIVKELPPGRGQPAFVLYSCAGGPENAGVAAWALLQARGYRVLGRGWGIYPLNVVTFRLGTKGMWRLLDRVMPLMREVQAMERMGEAFACGEPAGLPFILWPFPLVLLGAVAENKWINRWIYRNYAWKRRCNGCGLCVRCCPVGRLRMEDGYPRARGTCALCLGCINHCPTNAMQMLFFSEYGQPYRARWPRLLAKHRPRRSTKAADS